MRNNYRKRIAYIMDTPIPSQSANSVHVMKMCNAFSSIDLDTSLFCFENIANEQQDPYSNYGIKNTFKLISVKCNSFLAKHIRHYSYIVNSIKISFAVRKTKFDYLYGRAPLALLLLSNYRPFVYEAHLMRTGIWSYIEKKMLKSKNCKKLVVITKTLKEDYVNKYGFFDPQKIDVLPDGADEATSEFDLTLINESQIIHSRKPVIGYLGHLYPGKCMEVMSLIARARPGYVFNVVGGTDEWVDYWKDYCIRENLSNIIFYGYVRNCNIPYYYSIFDIVLIPSSNTVRVSGSNSINIGKYTSPLKLFEAMSFGKAIISTNLPGVEEIITNGIEGYVVPSDDIDLWCTRLDELVLNEERRLQLGNKAREKFLRHYTWKIRANKAIKLFE